VNLVVYPFAPKISTEIFRVPTRTAATLTDPTMEKPRNNSFCAAGGGDNEEGEGNEPKKRRSHS